MPTLFIQHHSIVSSIVTKEQVQLSEIDELIKKKFDSSFPSFISLFTKRHTLSSEEIEQIRKMIDNVDN